MIGFSALVTNDQKSCENPSRESNEITCTSLLCRLAAEQGTQSSFCMVVSAVEHMFVLLSSLCWHHCVGVVLLLGEEHIGAEPMPHETDQACRCPATPAACWLLWQTPSYPEGCQPGSSASSVCCGTCSLMLICLLRLSLVQRQSWPMVHWLLWVVLTLWH